MLVFYFELLGLDGCTVEHTIIMLIGNAVTQLGVVALDRL